MLMESTRHQGDSRRSGLGGRLAAQVRQWVCALHGHDSLLHFEQGRLSLLCSSCGHQTPGWDVKSRAADQEQPGRRPHVVRMPLVGERRVA